MKIDLIVRTPFARVASVDAELRKLGILRIVTGLVCLWRTVPLVWSSAFYFEPSETLGIPEATLQGFVQIALITLATAGVASPLSLAAVLVLYPPYESGLNSETLGTAILCLLLGLMILGAGGARVSVDAWLMKRGGRLGRAVAWLYRPLGLPRVDDLRMVYFLFFLAFAAINFAAVMYHVRDATWRSGGLLTTLLTSSYLCRFWAEFRYLEAVAPGVMTTMSVVGSIGQAAFQFLMIPLIFVRAGARFVIAWGTLFFLVSSLFLQLSYLPYLELLFWWALFLPSRPAAGPAFAVTVPPRGRWAARAIALALATLLATFAVLQVPWTDAWTDRWEGPIAVRARRVIERLGLIVPIVFNEDDLRMGDAWAVIYRGDTMLPYHGVDGQRLAWVQWSDILYFANSLRWRREFGRPDIATYLAPGSQGYGRLEQVAYFDHRRRGADESAYTVVYYATDGSRFRIPVSERFRPRLLGSAKIVCTGTGREIRCRPPS